MRRRLVALTAAENPSETTGSALGRALSFVVVALAAAGVAGGIAVDIAGRGAFPTHPVSLLALGGGAVAVWAITGSAHPRSIAVLRLLSVWLLLYLWLGVAACALDDVTVAVAWSVAWMPLNGLIVLVGLVAAAMPRSAWSFGVLTAVATAIGAALARPGKPFDGLPTASPESWAVRVPWLGDALLAAFAAAMVAAVVVVVIRAARAHVTERRYLANCAATTSMGIGLMVMCIALAALRDPGEVSPSTGSVGYMVAIALAAVTAACGSLASPWPLRVVIGYWAAALALVAGVYAATVTPAALGVVLTVAVTVAVLAGAVGAVIWLERRFVIAAPRPVSGIPRLSPRENEVLAAVAAGATNAGIAAELFLSERTVEQHVRSIFAKLDLVDRDASNHRVRAAVIWWQHQENDTAPAAADDLDRVRRANRRPS